MYTCVYIYVYIIKFLVQNSFADRCITLNTVFCLQCIIYIYIYMLFYVVYVLFNSAFNVYIYMYTVSLYMM